MSGPSKSGLFTQFLLVLAILLFLAGCGGGGGGGEGGGGGSETASVTISTSDPTDVQNAGIQPASIKPPGLQPLDFGKFSDIVSVVVEVYDGGVTFTTPETISGTLLNASFTTTLVLDIDGNWTGTIPGLPVGQSLTFAGHAYNSAATKDSTTEIFTGVSGLVQMSAGGNSVTIQLGPHTINLAFPTITAIRKPFEVKIGTTVDVDVDVAYSPSTTLSYDFTPAGGTIDTDSGTGGDQTGGSATTNGSGFAAIPTSEKARFSAGSTTGVFTNSLIVTDQKGTAADTTDDVSTTSNFDLDLVAGEGNTGIVTLFAPVVSGMSVTRLSGANSGTVQFDPVVTDDSTIASYFWFYSGAGTLSFTGAGGSNNTLQGVMVGYDPAAVGDVELTVTDDDDLATTVTFPLPVFPDDAVITVYDFESGSNQGWTATGDWHVTNFKAAGSSQRSMWFGDESTQDVGSDNLATGTLVSSAIQLGPTPFLEFDLRNENGCVTNPCGSNKLDLEISNDNGANWILIAGDTALQTGNLFVFEPMRFDLAGVCANPPLCTTTADFSGDSVLFRLSFGRFTGASYDGPFIDNIKVNNK